MSRIERQIGSIKGHRVVVERDSNGKAISYKVAEFLTVGEFEILQREVAQNQEEIKRDLAREAELKAIEDAKKAEKEAIKNHKEKYSTEHFVIAHQVIARQIDLGLIEDDGSFSLLLDNVLENKLSVEDALSSCKELETLFEKIYGGAQ